MGRLCGDLALLAAIGQLYGRGDPAQDLYCLAQYECNLGLAMDPGDIVTGLGLVGLDSWRLVAPGQEVPKVVGFALSEGHVVLAQWKGSTPRRCDQWCALTEGADDTWRGIVCDWNLISHGVSSTLGGILTGHYVILSTIIPGWVPPDDV